MSTINETRPADALRAGDRQADERASPTKPLGGIAGWIDDRLGRRQGRLLPAKKVFPDHWSFMLGEIAMYSMIVCLLTGVFLTFWFVPSAGQVVYDGSYVPLRGRHDVRGLRARRCDISFDVRGGLLIRQIHHWAALIFVAVDVRAHAPRLLHRRVPQAARAQLGHRHPPARCWPASRASPATRCPTTCSPAPASAPRTASCSRTRSSASYMSFFLFGGEFPGEAIIPRLYTVHVLLIPAILLGLFTAHICCSSSTSTPSSPARAAPTRTSSATRCCPVYIAKAGGFFFIVFGVIALISAVC